MHSLRLALFTLLLTAIPAVASISSSSPDYENRYVQVTDTAHGTFTYQYDHRTRRVGRDESQAGGSAEIVSFSGGTSVQEYPANAANAPPAVEYIRGSDYGGGIGGILYTLRGGQPAFNSYNSRGDVLQLARKIASKLSDFFSNPHFCGSPVYGQLCRSNRHLAPTANALPLNSRHFT